MIKQLCYKIYQCILRTRRCSTMHKPFGMTSTSFCTYPAFLKCPGETQSDSRQKTWTECTSETSSSVT